MSNNDKNEEEDDDDESLLQEETPEKTKKLKPSPYFYYVDHSDDEDANPDFLAPASSVPNFIVKLHAVLIRGDLSDVITWMPHGRSWKILNEVRDVCFSCHHAVCVHLLTWSYHMLTICLIPYASYHILPSCLYTVQI